MQISILRTVAVAVLVSLLGLPLTAETPPKKRQLYKTTRTGRSQLPNPLDRITGNLHELEQNGLLTVTDVRINTVGTDRQNAIVWTLNVNRLCTCRRVVMLLDAYRDVRFYQETKQSLIEVHKTRLFYDEVIKVGAANSERLPRDSIIRAFVYLDVGDLVRIKRGEPNQVVFSRSGENLFRNLDQVKPVKKTYKVPDSALIKGRARRSY